MSVAPDKQLYVPNLFDATRDGMAMLPVQEELFAAPNTLHRCVGIYPPCFAPPLPPPPPPECESSDPCPEGRRCVDGRWVDFPPDRTCFVGEPQWDPSTCTWYCADLPPECTPSDPCPPGIRCVNGQWVEVSPPVCPPLHVPQWNTDTCSYDCIPPPPECTVSDPCPPGYKCIDGQWVISDPPVCQPDETLEWDVINCVWVCVPTLNSVPLVPVPPVLTSNTTNTLDLPIVISAGLSNTTDVTADLGLAYTAFTETENTSEGWQLIELGGNTASTARIRVDLGVRKVVKAIRITTTLSNETITLFGSDTAVSVTNDNGWATAIGSFTGRNPGDEDTIEHITNDTAYRYYMIKSGNHKTSRVYANLQLFGN